MSSCKAGRVDRYVALVQFVRVVAQGVESSDTWHGCANGRGWISGHETCDASWANAVSLGQQGSTYKQRQARVPGSVRRLGAMKAGENAAAKTNVRAWNIT